MIVLIEESIKMTIDTQKRKLLSYPSRMYKTVFYAEDKVIWNNL